MCFGKIFCILGANIFVMEGHTILLEDKLYKEITQYCKANDLKIGKFCNDLLKKSFATEKYGDIPFGEIKKEEILNLPTDTVDEKFIELPQDEPIVAEIPVENIIEEPSRRNEEENVANVTVEETPKEDVKPKSKKRRL